MVIRGGTRGNGRQLAYYLLAEKENDKVTVLEVDNKENADKNDLVFALSSWSLMGHLTKTDQSLYHCVINPAYGEDVKMTAEDWNKAADILAKETGFEQQRRAIVLHEKNGRIHAHVVYERYNHEKGIMISNSFNRLAQDRARKEMELVFEHQSTPDRNRYKDKLKKEMLQLWRQNRTGKDFVVACEQKGYTICKTAQRRAYSIVDENGISYDLPRQMKGVNTKEVADKLQGLKLPTDRQAIKELRKKIDNKKLDGKQEVFKDKIAMVQQKRAVEKERKLYDLARDFVAQKETVLENGKSKKGEASKPIAKKKADFREGLNILNKDTEVAKDLNRKKAVAYSFAQNKKEVLPSSDNQQSKKATNTKSEQELLEKAIREKAKKLEEEWERQRLEKIQMKERKR
jgi:hypothetical protein